jgi:hypothetical protein
MGGRELSEENKKLVLLKKIQECKVELQQKDIKKTAHNEYGKYYYFELGDFVPLINEMCLQHNLSNNIDYPEGTKAILTITDLESGEEKTWDMPLKVVPLKNCTEMQNIGAAQTYARKYLYQTAFEIAEHDSMDGGETPIDEDEILKQKPIDPVKIDVIKSMLKKTKSNEKQFLKYYKLNRVEDITNGIFQNVISTLEQKEKEMQENKKKTDTPDLGI